MTSVAMHPALQALDALSAAAPTRRTNLLGKSKEELHALMSDMGEPKFRAQQLYTGMYRHRRPNLEEMTDLPKAFRLSLGQQFDLALPRTDTVQVSQDGTRKYRFVAADGAAFEAVYIPEVAKGSRTNTLCVSSQTGCAVGCKFCFTASLRRNRNLAASEIVGQVLAVHHDVAPLGEAARVTNIVFMGMGEPLLNYNEVVRAAQLLIDEEGFDFSTRRLTISTSGIVPRIYELGQDVNTQLAISLNATTDEVRNEVMPINKKWPLKELLAAMRAYPLRGRRRITVEYVLLGGVNDTLEDARRLPGLLAGIPVKVNLLPLNAHDRTPYSPPNAEQVRRFQDVLRQAGLNALCRTPRGHDIAAACGQLGETITAEDNRGSKAAAPKAQV